MYLRYLAQYYNEEKEIEELGFFSAAEYLKKYVTLSVEDQQQIETLIHWFDHELPIPDYYQDERNRQKAKSATSWFKDSAQVYIDNMNQLAKILEDYHVVVERIYSKKLPGKKIYEDDFQVTILPYRDLGKKVQ